MSSLVLDAEAVGKLKSVGTITEILDESGNVIGSFQPAVTPSNVDQYDCPLDDDEIQRRIESGGGKPLREIQ
ncbi:MAG: hypothetical protein O3A00_25650 [Planctomycetota bacterium]|nr:hypothetical protein [Planctomycetota bacterium]